MLTRLEDCRLFIDKDIKKNSRFKRYYSDIDTKKK